MSYLKINLSNFRKIEINKMNSLDYNEERNTIINDGSFSILSIVPMGMTQKRARQFLINVKKMCISASRNYGFVIRAEECAIESCVKKSNKLKHCACFDIVDSFVGEKTTTLVPCGNKKKTSEPIRFKKRNASMRMY